MPEKRRLIFDHWDYKMRRGNIRSKDSLNISSSIWHTSLSLRVYVICMGPDPFAVQIIFWQWDVWTYLGFGAYKAKLISKRILINWDLWPWSKSLTRKDTRSELSMLFMSKYPLFIVSCHHRLYVVDCLGRWQHLDNYPRLADKHRNLSPDKYQWISQISRHRTSTFKCPHNSHLRDVFRSDSLQSDCRTTWSLQSRCLVDRPSQCWDCNLTIIHHPGYSCRLKCK